MPFFFFWIAFFITSLCASAQTLQLHSGNGQAVQENFAVNRPLSVRAIDAGGRGIANAQVTWTIKSGEGALTSIGGQTDAEGYATASFRGVFLPPGQSYRTSIVNASASVGNVDFVVTTTTSRTTGGSFASLPLVQLIAPTGDLSGPAGSVLPQAVGVRVVSQAGLDQGKGVPFVGLRMVVPENTSGVYATCSGPNNMVLTNEQGEAFCDLVLGPNAGTALLAANVGEYQNTALFPVTITAAPACNFILNPATASVAATGGPGTVTVSAGQGCAWTASTTASWINITGGASGQGSGNFTYSVQSNTGGARTGAVNVAGRTFTINQAGSGGGPGPGPSPITFFTTSPLPNATVGSNYNLSVLTTGGTCPFQWTATGTFSPGLGLNPANGQITGVPTAQGTFAFTIVVTDANGASAQRDFLMTVLPPAPASQMSITTTSLLNGSTGSAYQQTITSAGACGATPFGGGTVTWALAGGTVPPGLTLAQSGTNYTLAGTPGTAGDYSFSVRVTDTCGRNDTRQFSVSITAPPVPPSNLEATPSDVAFAVAYTAPNSADQTISIRATGAPVSFSVSATAPWLSVQPSGAALTSPVTLTARAVNLESFAPGVYSAAIVLTPTGGSNPFSIPVTLTVAAPSNVSVAPESLTFNHSPVTPISQQALNVSGLAGGVRFSVTRETDSGGAWLTVTPEAGQTPQVLSVTVNTAGFQPGSYTGRIRIVPDGNAAGARTVAVTVAVAPASSLTVNQTPLSFSVPGTQILSVGATGAPIRFTAVAVGGNWLSVSPAEGATPANVSVSVTGLTAGQYQGSVVITPENTNMPVTIPVSVNVSQGQPAISAITNAASFVPSGVAPGELVTIFGTNLGPAQLVSAQPDASGTLPTTLADVRVLFDNVPAPILYVASGQVSAIAPFGTFGRTASRIQVVNAGLQSSAAEAAVVDAAPGIFVLNTTGQGAIVNQDGTINGSANGTEPGSVIAIYATGGGLMDLPVTDGRVVTTAPYPRTLLPVGVRIGGRVADVTYYGAAPGLVAGMLQVNARIPEDTPRGTAVPIQIIVGTTTSQPNVIVHTRP